MIKAKHCKTSRDKSRRTEVSGKVAIDIKMREKHVAQTHSISNKINNITIMTNIWQKLTRYAQDLSVCV